MCLLATLEFESGLYLYPQIQYYIYSSSLSASESDFRMYYSHCLLVTNELLLHLDFSILGCAFCATFGTDFLVSENATNYQNVWHILISTNLHCRMDSSLSLNISLSFTFDKVKRFRHHSKSFCNLCFCACNVATSIELCPTSNSHSNGFLRLISSNYGSHGLPEFVHFILKSRCSLRSAHITKSCYPFSISISLCCRIFPDLISVCKELNAAPLVDQISPSTWRHSPLS